MTNVKTEQSPAKKIKREDKTPVKSSVKRPFQQEDSTGKPSKRMKVDHDEQVNQLFQGSQKIVKSEVELAQKKYMYKLVSDNKDKMNKVSVDKLWKKFQEANDNQAYKKAGKNQINNKEQMADILVALETDNLVMYSADDGEVVLIWSSFSVTLRLFVKV